MQNNIPAKQPMHWTLESIVWQEVNPDGTKYALLEGVRNEPGVPFTYAFFIPAGFWDAPHSHTADARIVVIAGALQLGYGETLDTARAEHFAVGSYLLVPAHAIHFDGSEVDTLIIGTAIGSWSTTYIGS